MIKESFRVLGRWNKEGLNENNWRNLVNKKLKEVRRKNLYPRFFDSENGARIYPTGNEYSFDIGVRQDGLIVIFTGRKKGVKINGVLNGIEQKVKEAVILEKGKPPRYACYQCGDLLEKTGTGWQMMPEGKDSNILLSSAFSAMNRSVPYDPEYLGFVMSDPEGTKTKWKSNAVDMPGINLLLQESAVSAVTTIGYPQAV